MKKIPTDSREILTPGMREYINAYGWHFSKKMAKYAISMMKRKEQGAEVDIDQISKEELDSLLERYNVNLDHKVLYDYVYVANMCKADCYKSSVPDDEHLALFVKDTIDDVDGSDELPFRYWCQKMVAVGEYIPWDDML